MAEEHQAEALDAPTGDAPRDIPNATVGRLVLYLRVLAALAEVGTEVVSSEKLAQAAGVNSAKLRKDLSFLGSNGVRGVGYDVALLTDRIESALGLDHGHRVVLVGAGHLGRALAGYGGFGRLGFSVIALFDIDPEVVGTVVRGLTVHHMDELARVCGELGETIGVIATPPEAAQQVCDELVAAGVESILNFAPVVLRVPAGIELRRVDLALEMQVLSFHIARNRLSRGDEVAAPSRLPDTPRPAGPRSRSAAHPAAGTSRSGSTPTVGSAPIPASSHPGTKSQRSGSVVTP